LTPSFNLTAKVSRNRVFYSWWIASIEHICAWPQPTKALFLLILTLAIVFFITEWIRTDVPAVHHFVGGWRDRLILLALFAVVAVITQFMSDAATTALFAPVAVALAQALGRPPEPFVATVAMAFVVAFLTPIGRHGNLLVYGPGRYRFGDFVKVGTPLTVICALVVAMLTPLIWKG